MGSRRGMCLGFIIIRGKLGRLSFILLVRLHFPIVVLDIGCLAVGIYWQSGAA